MQAYINVTIGKCSPATDATMEPPRIYRTFHASDLDFKAHVVLLLARMSRDLRVIYEPLDLSTPEAAVRRCHDRQIARNPRVASPRNQGLERSPAGVPLEAAPRPSRLRLPADVGVEGRLGNAERAADLFYRVLSLRIEVEGQRTLLGIEAHGPPALPAPCPSRFEPGLGPLLVEDERPAGGRGVDVLMKALKADALLFEFRHFAREMCVIFHAIWPGPTSRLCAARTKWGGPNSRHGATVGSLTPCGAVCMSGLPLQ